MSADWGMGAGKSTLSRLVSRVTGSWLALGLGLLLVLLPLGAAWIDGVLDELAQDGHLRVALLPSTIIIYILALSPFMERMQADVIRAFRPLVLLDDEAYRGLVVEASRPNSVAEVVAFVCGAIFGLWISLNAFAEEGIMLLTLCLVPLLSLMLGLLVWTIYRAIADTRLTAELLHQPLEIDIFDITSFEPIGRISLAMSLVILGGVLLGLLLGLARDTLYDWRNWLMYTVLALVAVLVFFLNMRDTHRVLAAEKKRELDDVQRNILRACRALMVRLDEGAGDARSGSLGAEINALVAYEKRVQATRTWPYNTSMLRTLFVSVIIPVAGAVARVVGELMSL